MFQHWISGISADSGEMMDLSSSGSHVSHWQGILLYLAETLSLPSWPFPPLWARSCMLFLTISQGLQPRQSAHNPGGWAPFPSHTHLLQRGLLIIHSVAFKVRLGSSFRVCRTGLLGFKMVESLKSQLTKHDLWEPWSLCWSYLSLCKHYLLFPFSEHQTQSLHFVCL